MLQCIIIDNSIEIQGYRRRTSQPSFPTSYLAAFPEIPGNGGLRGRTCLAGAAATEGILNGVALIGLGTYLTRSFLLAPWVLSWYVKVLRLGAWYQDLPGISGNKPGTCTHLSTAFKVLTGTNLYDGANFAGFAFRPNFKAVNPAAV